MSEFVWYSEIALGYLLSSFIVATVVGRFLRQASQPDLRGLDVRPVDRVIGTHFSSARTNRRDVLTVP